MKKIILLLILLPFVASSQKTVRVLFVGNSYTYVNNLPQLVADIALSKGDTLIFDSNTPGGYTLQAHSSNATTLSKIAQGNWDYVIIQAQSQEPSFSSAQVATDVLPYAHKLDSLVHAANPCTETVFYMTWGRKNGDASNCGAYPPLCTYSGMQERLRQSYLLMGQQNNASVCPIGCVWRDVRNLNPVYDLYSADESHPSAWGSYLAACAFYEMIFQNKVLGSNYYFTLPQADAQQIQQVTNDFYNDSLIVYADAGNIPFASFGYNVNGLSVQFANVSINGNSYQWDFGDGNISAALNPNHSYLVPGTYTVTLLIAGNCKNDTYSEIVTVNNVSIDEVKPNLPVINFYENILFVNSSAASIVKVYTTEGKEMFREVISNNAKINFSELLPKGFYIVEVSTVVNRISKKIIISDK